MADKLGFYLCTDCGIGDALNIEELQKIATSEMRAPICKAVPFLCSTEGVQVIKDDLNNEGVNKIVIGACSQRVNTDMFNFDELKYYTERVNLREHVVWTQPANDPKTQMMANDYVRMGITRAMKASCPVPKINENLNKTILVVGGGVTGLTAAIEAEKAGKKVIVIEKQAELGG
ncbi:methyl-viologen-reducing hydrogenase subunit delta [Candidatus Magnetoovum chiemensis]|nr:methyl-viologen-reducing hydrogenase subunit delta [Candidatus Magnetoovum chiemensis]